MSAVDVKKDDKVDFGDANPRVVTKPVSNLGDEVLDDDDAALAQRVGHRSEFAREFKSFSTCLLYTSDAADE